MAVHGDYAGGKKVHMGEKMTKEQLLAQAEAEDGCFVSVGGMILDLEEMEANRCLTTLAPDVTNRIRVCPATGTPKAKRRKTKSLDEPSNDPPAI